MKTLHVIHKKLYKSSVPIINANASPIPWWGKALTESGEDDSIQDPRQIKR